MKNQQPFGLLVKEARDRRGLSIQDFAQRTRMQVFDIQDIEAGEKPSVGFVYAVIHGLKLTPAEQDKFIKKSAPHVRLNEIVMSGRDDRQLLLQMLIRLRQGIAPELREQLGELLAHAEDEKATA